MPLSIQELLKPPVSAKHQAIRDFLDKDKSGNLFSVEDLMRLTNCGTDTLHKFSRHPATSEYRVKHGVRYYFAKPALVAEFKKASGVRA